MHKRELQEILVKNINKQLVKHNISMRQLSTDINTSDSYMQKIMAMQMMPSYERLVRIAERFEIPVSALFEEDSEQSHVISSIMDYLLQLESTDLEIILSMTKHLVEVKDKQ